MGPLVTPPISPEASIWVKFTAEIMWIVFAMAGGIARYLDTYLRTGVIPRLGMLFAHAVVSGFSGYTVAQVVLRIQPEWAMVAAGIGGYLGTQGIDWLASVLKNRLLPGGDDNGRP